MRKSTGIRRPANPGDAFATAAFAMGPEQGLAWTERQPSLEALAILPDPAAPKRATSEFLRFAV